MIVAAYRTKQGIAYIDDSAYAGKSREELERVKRDMNEVACSILRRLAMEGIEIQPWDLEPAEEIPLTELEEINELQGIHRRAEQQRPGGAGHDPEMGPE